MSYREPSIALRARRDVLVEQLAAAKKAAAEGALPGRPDAPRIDARETRAREARVAVLERQREVAEALCAGEGPPPGLLDSVSIASPCKARWDEDMVGDDRVRFCGQCGKNVYNLSAMARETAEELLREHETNEGRICVRLFRRADGTVMTADCPEGTSRKRRHLALYGAVATSLMAAGAGLALHASPGSGTECARPDLVAVGAAMPNLGSGPGEPVDAPTPPPSEPPHPMMGIPTRQPPHMNDPARRGWTLGVRRPNPPANPPPGTRPTSPSHPQEFLGMKEM